jgi:putative methionine-R-sulfoxide reductase with GAF domain
MDYSSLQEKARFRMVPDMVANASNIAALVYHEMIKQKGPGSVNWVGFYFSRPIFDPIENKQSTALVLGPFQGLPAVPVLPQGIYIYTLS